MNKQKSLMHDLISSNSKACNEDLIPEGYGEFGLDKTNPIPIYGIDNIDNYFNSLRYESISKDGEKLFLPVQYNRTIEFDNVPIGSKIKNTETLVGSTYADNIGENIDVYNVYTFDGSYLLAKLFVHCYHWKTSTKAPQGFVYFQNPIKSVLTANDEFYSNITKTEDKKSSNSESINNSNYNFFSFEGRIRRSEFAVGLLVYFVINFLVKEIALNSESKIILLAYIPMLWFLWAQGAKRCHDLGHSGWYQIIPFYVFWLIFKDGEVGNNQYGPNPKGKN